MRSLRILLISLTLGACASLAQQRAEPSIRIDHGDLDLASRDGRAELRGRVRAQIETFCRYHRQDVVPQVGTRLDLQHCHLRAREVVEADMPAPVRRAYRAALAEGGGGTL